MTYQEAGTLFGMSGDAARKRAHRLGWRVQAGNDGKARLLVPEGADLRPDGRAGRPAGHPDGRADDLPAELRRRAEGAEARAEALAGELVQQRERAARAEGEAMTLRHGLENALGRAERAEARADAEARTAIETRRQVTEAMMQVASLQTERDAMQAAAEATQAAREAARAEAAEAARQAALDAAQAAEAELAARNAGGPLARAWRAFCGPQASGAVWRDIGVGVAWGSGIALAIWLVLR
jgi:hypothetical protein